MRWTKTAATDEFVALAGDEDEEVRQNAVEEGAVDSFLMLTEAEAHDYSAKDNGDGTWSVVIEATEGRWEAALEAGWAPER